MLSMRALWLPILSIAAASQAAAQSTDPACFGSDLTAAAFDVPEESGVNLCTGQLNGDLNAVALDVAYAKLFPTEDAANRHRYVINRRDHPFVLCLDAKNDPLATCTSAASLTLFVPGRDPETFVKDTAQGRYLRPLQPGAWAEVVQDKIRIVTAASVTEFTYADRCPGYLLSHYKEPAGADWAYTWNDCKLTEAKNGFALDESYGQRISYRYETDGYLSAIQIGSDQFQVQYDGAPVDDTFKMIVGGPCTPKSTTCTIKSTSTYKHFNYRFSSLLAAEPTHFMPVESRTETTAGAHTVKSAVYWVRETNGVIGSFDADVNDNGTMARKQMTKLTYQPFYTEVRSAGAKKAYHVHWLRGQTDWLSRVGTPLAIRTQAGNSYTQFYVRRPLAGDTLTKSGSTVFSDGQKGPTTLSTLDAVGNPLSVSFQGAPMTTFTEVEKMEVFSSVDAHSSLGLPAKRENLITKDKNIYSYVATDGFPLIETAGVTVIGNATFRKKYYYKSTPLGTQVWVEYWDDGQDWVNYVQAAQNDFDTLGRLKNAYRSRYATEFTYLDGAKVDYRIDSESAYPETLKTKTKFTWDEQDRVRRVETWSDSGNTPPKWVATGDMTIDPDDAQNQLKYRALMPSGAVAMDVKSTLPTLISGNESAVKIAPTASFPWSYDAKRVAPLAEDGSVRQATDNLTLTGGRKDVASQATSTAKPNWTLPDALTCLPLDLTSLARLEFVGTLPNGCGGFLTRPRGGRN